ncbi:MULTISPECIES: lytic transglycosylase domain-containing protein [unclassified Pseudomonas]|uniref:lytic transglycosylase domain-containing protein n=1 Tax=unclassified Pseudomonas TaxID=196821 RepID=UPI0024498BE7|nr:MULTISPECIES: lytic transglycosylase domain-containing protein [unclassified Pseudomonas]MDG9926829.1 LysM peptidoglycan-binding domain-containing protein [Pseudomonas sp. GD04042]MDH0484365.1 LysM peptidoglycan-binding domain-containing protein [Pseudomonas sp. GD04015]MDH0606611.1 LysM peptidoglycan-binding domain-containing protein [Pseudomonas sp. GD03869]
MFLLPFGTLDSTELTRRARALAVMACMGLAGCQSTAPVEQSRDTDPAVTLQQEPQWLAEAVEPELPKDIWDRMRDGFGLQDEIGINPRIENQRLWFVSNPSFLENASTRGSLYIHYVVERLEERKMPMELALLPVIESAYNPYAYSRSHAVGLWQFIPSTGRHFNLRQTNWYDGRRDITASTNAALSYLTRLHDMFNGDWLLALAAYNAGEGTVSRAIERNQKLGLPTDYWNLPLPKETQDYVPKLLALSQIVMSPEAYGVALSPIANEPYFQQVASKPGLDLARLAAMVDMEEDELESLNPAFKKGITMDGPQHLLVPIDKAEQFNASLSLMKPQELVQWQEYRVRAGDNLHSIANRHHLTVNALKDVNKLSGNNLRVGQVLTIPSAGGREPVRALHEQVAKAPPPASHPQRYKVKRGDNLWQIANAHGVSLKDLQRWNGLNAGSKLSLGQMLDIRGGSGGTGNSVAAGGSKARQNVTYYQVKSGDSMYLIAQRFKVNVEHIQRWNPRSDSRALKPGQTLTLYLD